VIVIVIDRDPLVCPKAQRGRIAAARYYAVGRGPTIASGSMLRKMIAARTIAERQELAVQELIDALGLHVAQGLKGISPR
jgi:NifU-like protein involved in Fe-S cluster formation